MIEEFFALEVQLDVQRPQFFIQLADNPVPLAVTAVAFHALYFPGPPSFMDRGSPVCVQRLLVPFLGFVLMSILFSQGLFFQGFFMLHFQAAVIDLVFLVQIAIADFGPAGPPGFQTVQGIQNALLDHTLPLLSSFGVHLLLPSLFI